MTLARTDRAGLDRGFRLGADAAMVRRSRPPNSIFAMARPRPALSLFCRRAALSRIARFAVTGQQGAGTVWLWDSADRSRRAGLVDAGASAQPLLSDMHYIRKALEPFAEISEGTIESLVATSPDAILMTDIGEIAPADAARLSEWVDKGGALIRFAGPVLAAQGDDLAAGGLAPHVARARRRAGLGRTTRHCRL